MIEAQSIEPSAGAGCGKSASGAAATDEEILEGVAEVARVHLQWDGALQREQRLIEDLELDSLKSLILAVEVENRFRVCLDPESEALILTVGDLVDAIRVRLEERGGVSDERNAR